MANRLPDVVANAIGQRFAPLPQMEPPVPPPQGTPMTPAQRAALIREEMIVITPMMQNVQVAQELPQPTNPLTITLANTRSVAGQAKRHKYSVKPVRDT